MSYEDEQYPERVWDASWGAHLLQERFQGSTPFTGPAARQYLASVAMNLPGTLAEPIAFPRGEDFARARAAVGLAAHDLQAVFGLMPGHLAQ